MVVEDAAEKQGPVQIKRVRQTDKASRRQPKPVPKKSPAKERTKQSTSDWLKDKAKELLGLTLIVTTVAIGINGRETRRLFPDEGLGYALGIVGSLLILTLLLYPLRKRYRVLKFLGSVKNWFKTHMTLGVVGPLAILYHSNFSLGSLNSTVALFAMLLVASSGLIGRFLYTKIHHGLFGRKKQLKELVQQVQLSLESPQSATRFVPNLVDRLNEYEEQVTKLPKGFFASMALPFRLSIRTRLGYFQLARFIKRSLKDQAKRSPAVAQHQRRMRKACKKHVRIYMRRVRSVAAFSAYDRLFALWHKVHLPFFIILLITAIIHVIAVHWYAL